jgi:hypothetical protein
MVAPGKPVRREFVADSYGTERKPPPLTEQMAKARALFSNEDFRGVKAECRRILRDPAMPEQAKMEAMDMLDRVRVDPGPLAAVVAGVIIIGLLFMFLVTKTGAIPTGH